jgi:putative membrane protein
MKHALPIAALIAVAALATTQNSGTSPSQYTPDRDPMSMQSDADFLSMVAQDDMAEVAVGRLAANRATNSKVKSGARIMVNDHAANFAELRRLATRKGVILPDSPSADQQAMMDRLRDLRGAEFNKQYVSEMLDDHMKALNLLRDRISAGGDAQVTAFARKTFTAVRKHAVMWNALAKTYKLPTQEIPSMGETMGGGMGH